MVVQAQVQRALAQQMVQQQQAAQMHAQLSQAPQAFPGQPSLGPQVSTCLFPSATTPQTNNQQLP